MSRMHDSVAGWPRGGGGRGLAAIFRLVGLLFFHPNDGIKNVGQSEQGSNLRSARCSAASRWQRCSYEQSLGASRLVTLV